MTLVERARKLLDGHPPAIEGSGGNRTTFAAACALVWGFAFSPEEAMPLMLEYNGRCEPPWAPRELERMLRNVLSRNHKEERGHFVNGHEEKGAMAVYAPPPRVSRKKEHDLTKLKELQDRTLPCEFATWRPWLRERSPVDPREVDPIKYLNSLYRPGEKILIFNRMWGTQGDYGHVAGNRHAVKLGGMPGAPNEKLSALPTESPEGMTFLMQPVDAQWYPVERSGRIEMSRRTKKSVTRWPYILLESDKVPFELWLNCLVRMRLRIVSITHSGGRSLHALCRLDKETEDELQAEIQDEAARETLALLGTDTQALNTLVYPRLPNTFRKGKRMSKRDPVTNEVMKKNGRAVMEFVPFHDGARKQALLYFNPGAEIGRCIAEGMIFERA